jgi:AbrB family looped-hinge helix DNA binding protein
MAHRIALSVMETNIDRDGRIVIPKSIREAAGLKPGMRLEIDYREGKIQIKGKSLKNRLIRKGSVMVVSVPGAPKMSVDAANEWIGRSRDREI